jgi:type I restriction enzyme S subunit
MGSDWKMRKLEDIAQVIDSRHKTPQYSDEGYPMVRVVDVKGGILQLDGTKKVNEEVYADFSKGKDPEIGDLIISRVGSYGNIAYVNSLEKFCLGQNTASIIPNDKSRFLYYTLISPQVKAQIEQMVVGAVQKTISLKTIKSLEVPQPPKKIKEAVAKFLGDIDDKIELNNQTNQTLEQMAQALFKSWFVDFDPVFDNLLAKADFKLENLESTSLPEELVKKAKIRLLALNDGALADKTKASLKALAQGSPPLSSSILPQHATTHAHFPNEFEHNEQLGWIPKGWKEVTLESLITLIGGGTPKTSIEEYWNGNIPWFSVVDAPNDSDVFVVDTDKHVTQLGVDKSSTKILRMGTTIISARGTVGKCSFVGTPMAMNQSCYGINGINNISDEFIYYLTKHQVSDLQKRGHGSVFNTITRETFKSILLPFSGEKLTTEFSNIVSALFDKILMNNKQNFELTKLRDTLLPKLISGELQIPDVETPDEKIA